MQFMANGHGGARQGAGRKKGSTSPSSKNERIVLCCTHEQAANLKELALKDGKSISAFILDLIEEKLKPLG